MSTFSLHIAGVGAGVGGDVGFGVGFGFGVGAGVGSLPPPQPCNVTVSAATNAPITKSALIAIAEKGLGVETQVDVGVGLVAILKITSKTA